MSILTDGLTHALYFTTRGLSILLKCKTGTLYPSRRIIGESDKIRPLWTSAPLTNQCEVKCEEDCRSANHLPSTHTAGTGSGDKLTWHTGAVVGH